MPDVPQFEGCSAEDVFAQVTESVRSPEARDLWLRMLKESKRKGVGASISYLEAEFAQIKEHYIRELSRLEAET